MLFDLILCRTLKADRERLARRRRDSRWRLMWQQRLDRLEEYLRRR